MTRGLAVGLDHVGFSFLSDNGGISQDCPGKIHLVLVHLTASLRVWLSMTCGVTVRFRTAFLYSILLAVLHRLERTSRPLSIMAI